MSDSEDSDSDSGIRFKTTSTRHSNYASSSNSYDVSESKKRNFDDRKHYSKRREHSRRSPSSSSRRRRRSRSRSRDRSRERNTDKSRRNGNSSKSDHSSERNGNINRSEKIENNNTSENITPAVFGPALPPTLKPSTNETNNLLPTFKEVPPRKERSVTPEICGPALPPHLRKGTEETVVKPILGPTLPPNFQPPTENTSNFIAHDITETNEAIIGPMPIDANMTTAQLELEKRALELKLAKLDSNDSTNLKADQREEWMLELPAIRSIAGLGVTNRQFQTRERPDFSDRSSWTDTPDDKIRKQMQPSTHEEKKQSIQEQAQALYNKKRDAEQEKLATKHKKHKRDKSLVEMHQKKLKKEKKKKKAEGEERRPFSREVDLQINRFDQAKTNSVIKKAKLLDTKFSSGETKYL